jgi:hypothetical protein
MIRIESVIDFKYGIPCKKEVLGKEFSITIGTNKGVLAFPNIPDNFLDEFDIDKNRLSNLDLIQPKNSDIQLPCVKEATWGKFSDNLGNSCVKQCGIWIPCSYENYKDVANGIGNLTEEYIRKFTLFLELLSKEALDEKIYNNIEVESSYQFWIWGQDRYLKSAENTTINVNVHCLSDDCFFSHNLVSEAIELTNEMKEPNYSRVLLRDAMVHRNNHDFRRAILDAATAIEIAFTNKIINEFNNRGIGNDDFSDSILRKFHSLNGRIELLSSLGIKLPISQKVYKDFLSNIRNRAIHAGYESNRAEASKVIDAASETVLRFCDITE